MRPFFFLLFVCIFRMAFPMASSAQVIRQKGVARTVGRPANPSGTRLSGVLLRVHGQHNEVRSNKQGSFVLTFAGKQAGKDNFSFSSVRLAGYELQEREMLGRSYALSSTVPVEVVLVPQALKLQVEERIRKQVEANYRKKLRDLLAQKDRLKSNYQLKLQQLEQEYEKRDRLVDELAERYASMDYKSLSPMERQLGMLIEGGQLESADSLLRTVSIPALMSDYESLAARGQKLRGQLAQNAEAEASVYAQIVSVFDAKANIFRLRFENDSAACYMEKIAMLDTSQVKPLLKAADFIAAYLGRYDRALSYDSIALRQSIKQNGENDALTAVCRNNMGKVFLEQGHAEQALSCYLAALPVFEAQLGDSCQTVAVCRDNIGYAYYTLNKYEQAKDYLFSALSIRKALLGEAHKDVATSYNNIGNLYISLKQYDKALEYHEHALSILRQVFCGKKHPYLGKSLSNMGYIYEVLGQADRALDCNKEALSILQATLGDKHPDVAEAYLSVGRMETSVQHFNTAIDSYGKALDIFTTVYGAESHDAAKVKLFMGKAFMLQGQFAKALDDATQALQVLEGNSDTKPSELVSCKGFVAYLLMQKGDSEQALSLFKDVLSCMDRGGACPEELKGNIDAYMASCYSSLYGKSATWLTEFKEFMRFRLYTATVFPRTPAAERGMQGKYYVVAYGGWALGEDSGISPLYQNACLQGKPKTVTFYRNGEFREEHFDNQIGIQMGVENVGEKLCERILKEWAKWNTERACMK